jgi:putative ABC transport system ATP-binding protein
MILETEKLSKKYRRGDREFSAVADACLRVEKTDFVIVTGRSGSGKSTLLNLITGLLPPDSGTIRFESREFSGMDDRALSLLRNTRIGYIPQGHGLLPNLSVLDNVRLPCYLQIQRSKDAVEKARALLDRMNILHLQSENPQNLSGGELRRVSIARSLINDPVILVADEPTGDLDPDATKNVMDTLSEIHDNQTAIVMVTHDLALKEYANKQYVMDAGALIAHKL